MIMRGSERLLIADMLSRLGPTRRGRLQCNTAQVSSSIHKKVYLKIDAEQIAMRQVR